jgi:hypothetical protein
MIDKKTFAREVSTHQYRNGQYIYHNKKSLKSKHSFITVYFLMTDGKIIVLTKLRYKRQIPLTVLTWKKYMTQKDKVPKAIDLYLAGYNEKHGTSYELDRIFIVKFS